MQIATALSKTLAQLLGTALHTDLKKLTLQPAEDGIHFAFGGNASGASPELLGSQIIIETKKSGADSLKFFVATADSPIIMTVVQQG